MNKQLSDSMNKYQVAYIDRLRMGSDGKGIRSLIIFQQCSLRCKYCINSFTWDGSEEENWMDIHEIYKRVLADKLYIKATNGGVTFGGGEPLLQSDAIKEFSKIDTEGFSIDVETSLYVPKENLENVVHIIDMFYVDIKTTDPEIYKAYTDGEVKIPLDNLKYLINLVGPEKIVVRIPVIPGFTDKANQKATMNDLKSHYGVKHFDLFEYRIP